MTKYIDIIDITTAYSPGGYQEYTRRCLPATKPIEHFTSEDLSHLVGEPVYYNDMGQLVYENGERVLNHE